ncbi:MAG: HPr family phosphocarrier protein [Oscillibacter sp.]|nr:HPr family phosphocarrier protein [Oscillibacter sp.]
MKSFTYTIKDNEGIHARPAGILCKTCKTMAPNKVTLTKGDQTVECTKILAVMSLGVKCGETITLTVDGPDEDAKITELQDWISANL